MRPDVVVGRRDAPGASAFSFQRNDAKTQRFSNASTHCHDSLSRAAKLQL
jgi:hypothetical protein